MAAQGPQRIIFRADASRAIGGGHVMRCLTLADHFRAVGWSVGFATIAESLNVVPRLKSVAELLVSPDARALDAAALQSRWPSGCDVFVVDHYSLDAAYERSWRAFARHIVVIDDLANRPHDCDLLIDSNFGRQAGDYTALVPADALLLIGAGYAMLRPEFATHRAEALARRAMLKKVDRILVSLGLTDIGGITARIVQALIEIEGTFSIDVVIGHAAASRPVLEEIAAKTPRVFLHVDPPDMAALMSDTDLAIGAGGTTSWERCCLGLPTIVLVLADNQKSIAEKLADAGAVRLAQEGTIAGEADALIGDAGKLCEMSRKAAEICDGLGTQRIFEKISGVSIGSDPALSALVLDRVHSNR